MLVLNQSLVCGWESQVKLPRQFSYVRTRFCNQPTNFLLWDAGAREVVPQQFMHGLSQSSLVVFITQLQASITLHRFPLNFYPFIMSAVSSLVKVATSRVTPKCAQSLQRAMFELTSRTKMTKCHHSIVGCSAFISCECHQYQWHRFLRWSVKKEL